MSWWVWKFAVELLSLTRSLDAGRGTDFYVMRNIRIVGFRNLFYELQEVTGEGQQSFIGKVDTYVALEGHRNDVGKAWLETTPPIQPRHVRRPPQLCHTKSCF